MQQPEWKNGLVKLAELLLRLAWINLLWIGFTLLGLGVLGFLPATAAMFAVMRKWMQGNLDGSIYRQFWFYFKKEFWKANAAGLTLLFIGYILYFDLMIYDFGESNTQQVLHLLLFVVTFIYLLAVVFFFPIYVQYDLKWYQYMKYSVLMAFSSPFRAVWMLLIGYGVVFIMSKVPGTMIFFLGSTTAYLWMVAVLPLFSKLTPEKSASA